MFKNISVTDIKLQHSNSDDMNYKQYNIHTIIILCVWMIKKNNNTV